MCLLSVFNLSPVLSLRPYGEIYLLLKLLLDTSPSQANMTGEEWKALQRLANDRSILIKQADKDYSMVVWGREDYIKETENSCSIIQFTEVLISKRPYFQTWLKK